MINELFVIVAVLYFVVPVAVAGVLVWQIAGKVLEVLSRKKGKTLTAQKKRLWQIVTICIVGVATLLLWQVPKSTFWHHRLLERNAAIIKNDDIYLPNGAHQISTKLYIESSTHYISQTTATTSQGLLVKVEQDNREDNTAAITADKKLSYMVCGTNAKSDVQYCYNPTFSTRYYWLEVGGKGLAITFEDDYTEEQRLGAISEFAQRRIADLGTVPFYPYESYGRP